MNKTYRVAVTLNTGKVIRANARTADEAREFIATIEWYAASVAADTGAEVEVVKTEIIRERFGRG